jgi:phosphoribosyl 1,2-cyclic phosphodiesterase
MKVRFWGTRGSIPISLTAQQTRNKVVAALHASIDHGLCRHQDVAAFVDEKLPFEISGTFGGHTSCVQLESAGAEHVFMDFGTGARPLGGFFLQKFAPNQPQTYHVFMSHLHWDHIMGFPFFTPVYIPGNRIIIHTCHAQAEQAFRNQQSPPGFPVAFDALSAQIEFDLLQPGQQYDIAGYRVKALLQLHSGDSYGWRFERNGKSMVYSTDSEHKLDDHRVLDTFIDFFAKADLVVFDAMYTLADAVSVRADWGHSSNIVGIELCQAAAVKCLCMFHHEPAFDDIKLVEILAQSRRLETIYRSSSALDVCTAYDGLELAV